MNLGAPELLIILLIVPMLLVTVIGLVRAAQAGAIGWVVGIVGGWFFGLGWLVALIYLLMSRGTTAGVAAPAAAAGWLADPSGKHEMRFWDGSAWTANVSDQGVQAADPL